MILYSRQETGAAELMIKGFQRTFERGWGGGFAKGLGGKGMVLPKVVGRESSAMTEGPRIMQVVVSSRSLQGSANGDFGYGPGMVTNWCFLLLFLYFGIRIFLFLV